jgi:hypothetical protein
MNAGFHIDHDSASATLGSLLREFSGDFSCPNQELYHPAAALLKSWDESREALKGHRKLRIHVPEDSGFGVWAAAWTISKIASGAVEASDLNRSVQGILRYALAEAAGERLASSLRSRPRSVFIAACHRRSGVPVEAWFGGLFDEAAGAIRRRRDPRWDDVLNPEGEFAPELQLLGHDAAAYRRDLQKGTMMAAVLESEGHREVGEAVWVKDPESLLFIDSAWADTNSSLGRRGFALAIVSRGASHLQFAFRRPADRTVHRLSERFSPRSEFAKCQALCPDKKTDGPDQVAPALADSPDGWWTMRCEGSSDLEAVLREELEGRLFESQARWDREIRLLRPVPQAGANGMNEVPGFFVCPLGDLGPSGNHKLPRLAVKPIGGALQTLVRDPDDRRPGVGWNFEREHLQGDSGLLTVWSRRGMAVAYTSAAAVKIEDLRREFKEARSFAERAKAALEELRDDASSDDGATLKSLVTQGAKIQGRMAKPENRLLRRFFKALDVSELERSLYEVHTTADSHRLQKDVHAIELLIVGYYSFEFMHRAIAEALPLKWLNIVASLAAALVVWVWYRTRRLRYRLGVVLLVVMASIGPQHFQKAFEWLSRPTAPAAIQKMENATPAPKAELPVETPSTPTAVEVQAPTAPQALHDEKGRRDDSAKSGR